MSRQSEIYRTLQPDRRVSLDDEIYEGEIERCRLERGLKSGNGKDYLQGRVACDCAESVINNKRVVVHRPCDCRYVALRSALVLAAEKNTYKRVSVDHGDRVSPASQRWTKVFAGEMEKLAAPLLRQSDNGSAIGIASRAHGNGSNNGSASHNGAQNVELSAGPVSRRRNTIDASSAVVPMW